MQLYEWKPLSLGHHTTTFNDHRNCDSGIIVSLNYHMILQDYKVKGLWDYAGGIIS